MMKNGSFSMISVVLESISKDFVDFFFTPRYFPALKSLDSLQQELEGAALSGCAFADVRGAHSPVAACLCIVPISAF